MFSWSLGVSSMSISHTTSVIYFHDIDSTLKHCLPTRVLAGGNRSFLEILHDDLKSHAPWINAPSIPTMICAHDPSGIRQRETLLIGAADSKYFEVHFASSIHPIILNIVCIVERPHCRAERVVPTRIQTHLVVCINRTISTFSPRTASRNGLSPYKQPCAASNLLSDKFTSAAQLNSSSDAIKPRPHSQQVKKVWYHRDRFQSQTFIVTEPPGQPFDVRNNPSPEDTKWWTCPICRSLWKQNKLYLSIVLEQDGIREASSNIMSCPNGQPFDARNPNNAHTPVECTVRKRCE